MTTKERRLQEWVRLQPTGSTRLNATRAPPPLSQAAFNRTPFFRPLIPQIDARQKVFAWDEKTHDSRDGKSPD